MSGELISALCLVAVLEGLFLFVAPRGWKRAAEQLQAMPDRQLRIVGAVAVAVGVLALWAVRA
ncbi:MULTISPECIES: DUF2065 family protein [unclassified Lysobacter]|uniref:DUF2065 domain-containing protein n=1 Tax=unclassified Lysobacter TaxID=2635362 RepID=UPI00070119C3|nr:MULTISPECIES: DUF2065 family protein [unclassified Lysobacter]KRA20012.1 hypothetical protein ASD69_01240 [Lysobacter sp. Root604]KRD39025.1 hypothetical protein ASE35_01225 [Lysobacter sp. Root916]KRD74827.1 hypothetical protein ASE43_16590 [Lysobacter sp. Root983]